MRLTGSDRADFIWEAIWRKVQANELVTKYNEDEYFRLNVKKLIALTSLRLDKVVDDFNLIADQFEDDADELLNYFEKTWISERKRRGIFSLHSPEKDICSTFLGAGQKKPMFDHEFWNVHDRLITSVPCSDNLVEGWHNACGRHVAITHPDIVKLAEKIGREQSKFEVDMAKILQGHDIKMKKACYRRLDERISRLVNAFDSSQVEEFLKNMAANIVL